MNVRRHRVFSELKQGFGLLLAGQLATLTDKLRRRLRRSPLRRMSGTQLWDRAQAAGGVDLYIDADLGGGASDYLARQIAASVDAGTPVLQIAVHGLNGGLLVKSEALGLHHQSTSDYRALFADPRATALVKKLQVGTLVGFPDPMQLMPALRALMHVLSVNKVVTWHDYYLICPSHLLLNSSGRFCNVPTVNDCASCIASHCAPVDADVRREGLTVWRDACGQVLEAADELRVFSASSAQLLRAAYGSQFDERIRLCSHDMSYFEGAKIPTLPETLSTVAVIGRIGVHKGANVVADLVAEIRARALPLKLVIIGTSERRFDADIVTVYGRFRVSELPEILESQGASLVLMPSICPETFSYVAHEVQAMNVPLVTLPLGAQAECARGYCRGLVASSMQPTVLLDEILTFAAAGYGASDV